MCICFLLNACKFGKVSVHVCECGVRSTISPQDASALRTNALVYIIPMTRIFRGKDKVGRGSERKRKRE